jgi:hypothetical protein
MYLIGNFGKISLAYGGLIMKIAVFGSKFGRISVEDKATGEQLLLMNINDGTYMDAGYLSSHEGPVIVKVVDGNVEREVRDAKCIVAAWSDAAGTWRLDAANHQDY